MVLLNLATAGQVAKHQSTGKRGKDETKTDTFTLYQLY